MYFVTAYFCYIEDITRDEDWEISWFIFWHFEVGALQIAGYDTSPSLPLLKCSSVISTLVLILWQSLKTYSIFLLHVDMDPVCPSHSRPCSQELAFLSPCNFCCNLVTLKSGRSRWLVFCRWNTTDLPVNTN